MKLLVSVAVACQLAILLPAAMGQSNATAAAKLHLQTFTPRGNAVLLAANHIERDASTVHLSGNVEIRLRPSGSDRDAMVLHADEAVYHRDTGQIVPHGNVRVSLEKPK